MKSLELVNHRDERALSGGAGVPSEERAGAHERRMELRRGRSAVTLEGEGAIDDRHDLGGQLGGDLAKRSCLVLRRCEPLHVGGVAFVHVFPGERAIEHRREREDVGAPIDVFGAGADRLFGDMNAGVPRSEPFAVFFASARPFPTPKSRILTIPWRVRKTFAG